MIPGALETNVTPNGPSPDQFGRIGTTVTANSTIHTKGSWTELVASTSADTEGIYVKVTGVGSNGSATSMLLDIGTGGSGSETVLLPDLLVGYSGGNSTQGRGYFFPVAIASGTRISARCQALISSDTADVAIWLVQSTQNLEGASSVQAVGVTTASSDGTGATIAVDSWGAWTSLGSVSSDVNCLMPGVDDDGDSSTAAADSQWVLKLGYGTSAPGSGGTEIDALWHFATNGSEQVRGLFPNTPVYADISSGDNIYVSIAGRDSVNEPKSVIVHAMECPVASGGSTGVFTLVSGTGLVG